MIGSYLDVLEAGNAFFNVLVMSVLQQGYWWGIHSNMYRSQATTIRKRYRKDKVCRYRSVELYGMR